MRIFFPRKQDLTVHANCLLLFFPEKGCDISCKLSPLEAVCMKCQTPFSGKNKTNISEWRLLEILPSILSFEEEAA